MLPKLRAQFFAFVLWGVLVSGLSLGQSASTAILRGKVTDPSGAVIPHATISIASQNGKKTTAQSDNQGMYELKGVAPGTYTVTAVAPGFQADIEQNVAVAAGETKQFDLALNIAVQQENVQVQGEGPPQVGLSPSGNASSIVIQGKDLESLSDDPDELQSELEALLRITR